MSACIHSLRGQMFTPLYELGGKCPHSCFKAGGQCPRGQMSGSPAIVFNTNVVLTSMAVFSTYAVLTPVTYAF